jgi:hypothetical protein
MQSRTARPTWSLWRRTQAISSPGASPETRGASSGGRHPDPPDRICMRQNPEPEIRGAWVGDSHCTAVHRPGAVASARPVSHSVSFRTPAGSRSICQPSAYAASWGAAVVPALRAARKRVQAQPAPGSRAFALSACTRSGPCTRSVSRDRAAGARSVPGRAGPCSASDADAAGVIPAAPA